MALADRVQFTVLALRVRDQLKLLCLKLQLCLLGLIFGFLKLRLKPCDVLILELVFLFGIFVSVGPPSFFLRVS